MSGNQVSIGRQSGLQASCSHVLSWLMICQRHNAKKLLVVIKNGGVVGDGKRVGLVFPGVNGSAYLL